MKEWHNFLYDFLGGQSLSFDGLDSMIPPRMVDWKFFPFILA